MGESFEIAHLDDHVHVRRLWLVPVLEAEAAFCHRYGLEALEELFELNEIDYADPQRRVIAKKGGQSEVFGPMNAIGDVAE